MPHHLCPVCGSPLRQIHRRTIDRVISQFYRVHRFQCSNDECRWVGLFHSKRHKSHRKGLKWLVWILTVLAGIAIGLIFWSFLTAVFS